MSLKLTSLAWESGHPQGEKMVLLAICDAASDEGVAWPSVQTMANKCSMGVRTVQDHLNALEKIGAVSRKYRSGSSTMYYVFPAKFRTPAESAPPQISHPTPADFAPRTVSEPSVNRKGTVCISDQPSEVFGEADQKASAEGGIDPAVDARLGPLCRTLRTLNVDAAPHQLKHPDWLALLGRCSDDDIVGVAELAKAKKPGQRIALAYLAAMLSDAGTGIPPSRASPRPASKHEQRTAFFNEVFACVGGGHGRSGEAERVVDGEAWRVG